MNLKPTRRIVTGHDAEGRAVALFDASVAPKQKSAGGNAITMLWVTAETPADLTVSTDRADIPVGVQRVLEYLNARGQRFFAIEVSYFKGPAECFVPVNINVGRCLVNRSVNAPQRGQPGGRARPATYPRSSPGRAGSAARR